MGSAFSMGATPGKNGKPANGTAAPNAAKPANAPAPVTGGRKKKNKTRKSRH